jgi:hypothetical protein
LHLSKDEFVKKYLGYENFIKSRKVNGKDYCMFINDDFSCSIYPVRPSCCKKYFCEKVTEENSLKTICKNDTIQIEITNFCSNNCSNCTRFVHHVKKPFFMDLGFFKKCVDSLEGFPQVAAIVKNRPTLDGPYIGIMGGEPLLHPEFKEMCSYLRSKFPREQCGLWTAFPKGKEHYRKIICETFGNIFLNDHTRPDIYHHPFLVASSEIVSDPKMLYQFANCCPFQQSWSACLNPRGAWFCEMAGSLSMLFEEGTGWPIEKGWWYRTVKDFTSQIEEFCPKCGGCLPLKKRVSTEVIDDISPENYERLKGFSPKIKKGEFKIHDLKTSRDDKPLAAYKDTAYRDEIAKRYGMFLVINEQGFWVPFLYKNWSIK